MDLDAVRKQTAHAGNGEHRFNRHRTTHQRTKVNAGNGNGGNDRVSQSVVIHSRVIADALGLCRADIVGAQHFQHGRALGTGNTGQQVKTHGDGGQNVALPAVNTCRGQNTHIAAEQKDQHDTNPESGGRNTADGKQADRIVGGSVLPDGGNNTHGDGNNQRQSQCGNGQDQRIGNRAEQTHGNIGARIPGCAEMSPEQIEHIAEKLYKDRVADTQSISGLFNQLRSCVSTQQQRNGVAGSQIHNQVNNKDDADRHRDHVQQTLERILNHRS